MSFHYIPGNLRPSGLRALVSLLLLVAVAAIASAQNVSSLVLEPPTVTGGFKVRGIVTLASPAVAKMGVLVSVSSDQPFVRPSTPVRVMKGQTSARFQLFTSPVNTDSVANITATAGGSVSAPLTVQAAKVRGVYASPFLILGGTTAVGTISLTGVAPPGGVIVDLVSNQGVARVPVTVAVSAGSTDSNFTIDTSSVPIDQIATITASINGSTGRRNILVMAPTVSGISLDSSAVTGGTDVQATVTLGCPAGPAGYKVRVSNSDSAAATTPSTVLVPAGATQVSFTVPTFPVTIDHVTTITVKTPTSVASTQLTVSAPVLQSFSVTPGSVRGTQVATGKVTLTGPAPSGGITVGLASDQSAAKVPSAVQIGVGTSSVSFTVNTKLVGVDVKATLSATLGTTTRTAELNVMSPAISFFRVDTSEPISGSNVICYVGFDVLAPAGGLKVTLSSDKIFASVPPTVTVLEGESDARFIIHTTGLDTSDVATITAQSGGQKISKRLDVLAQGLSDWSCPGGNSQHTGLATGPAAVGEIAWGTPGSAPIETLFVSGMSKYGRTFGVKNWYGQFILFAADALNGNILWGQTYPLNYDSMPVLGMDGSILVCSGQILTAMSCQSSHLKWGVDLGALGMKASTSAVVATGGTIYLAGHGPDSLGADESVVVALDGQTGALLWKKLLGTPGGAPKQPSVGRDGTVYVALADGTVDALYPQDGSIKWSNPLGGPTQAPSIGFDGSVYIQMNTGVLYRLAGQDGAKLWSYLEKSVTALSRWPLIGPDGTVYIGVNNLYAINPANGAEKWHVHLGTKTSAFGIAAEGTVYAKADTIVYALNKLDGSVKWSLDIGNTQTLPVIGPDGILNYGTFAIR